MLRENVTVGELTDKECARRWRKLNEPTTDSHQPESVIGESIRFGGSFYQFAPLVPLYGSGFVFRLIIYFVEAFYSFAPTGNAKRLLGLRMFLGQLAKSALNYPGGTAERVHAQLSAGICPSADDMNDVAAEYGDTIRDFEDTSVLNSLNKTYRATHLESVSAVLRNLAPYGQWPLVAPIRRIDDRGSGHIPALGQLGPGRTRVAFEGRDAYARSVEASRARMAQLRKLAENGLLQAHATFENGTRLLSLDGIQPFEVIEQAVHSLTAYGANRQEPPLVELVFPRDNPDRRLANLLSYLNASSSGAVPSHKDPGGSWALDYLIKACGGAALVSAHLCGSKFALLCAQLITLIDTGMNVQPCTDLAAQPFAGEFRRGTVRLLVIVSTKDRPTEKEVISAVPIESAEALLNVPSCKISTKAAITMWQAMSHRMRLRAKHQGDNVESYLWICCKGKGNSGRIQQFTTTVAKSQMALFLEQISADPVLGGVCLSRQNIRPTWLMLRNAKNLDNQNVVSLANHADGGITFGSYLNRVEYRELLASQVRRFQDQLEASILVSDVSRLVHLSVDAPTIVGRAEEAIQSGLREILFDASGAKSEEIVSTPNVDLVPDSLVGFLRLDPNPNDLVTLVLVKKGLEAAEETFLVNNPERWKHKWMPGLALTSAAVARLGQSRHQMALKRAVHVADQGISSGEMRIFSPW